MRTRVKNKTMNWINDLSDKRHTKRLFGKYDVTPNNFKEIYKEILKRSNSTTNPKLLTEYYKDVKYLYSVEKALKLKEAQRVALVARLRNRIQGYCE